jgi:aryl-alcohol dehydrogenase-like predicted oxidoreductase
MEYAYLGRSNVKVSKICLGTMHFGRRTTPEDSFAIMDRALEMGIQFFDTANVYGDPSGRSEEIIGQWFQQGNRRREQVVLASKVYGGMGEGPNEVRGISDFKIRMNVADSLRRLQTDRIDLYQVHHIDRHISTEEFWGAFERLQQRGDILYVGTSNFPGWGLAKFQMAAWQRGNVGIVSEQSMYSLLCRYPELEVLPAAQEFGIGVIPYMPVAGGILTGKSRSEAGSRTQQVEGEYGIRQGQNEALDQFSALCRALGETETAVAIAWVLHQPAVTSAIVGVRTLEHLDGLERAASLELDAEALKRLDEIFDYSEGRPLRIAPAPEAYAW